MPRSPQRTLVLCALAFFCSLILPPAGLSADDAFKRIAPQLRGEQRLDARIGEAMFERLWISAPASTQAADGLGPLFNARACASCHPRNGRGRVPDADQPDAVGLVLHLDIPAADDDLAPTLNNLPEPVYGRQLQTFAVAGLGAEARLLVEYERRELGLADGQRVALHQPEYQLQDFGYGSLHPQARLSPRLAPPMIGLGLLDAVDEAQILQRADPDDKDGDGISGRPNRVWHRALGKTVLGRFGHKAGLPDLDTQIQSAFATDLGLSVPLYPAGSGDCSAAQRDCLNAPNGNSPQYDNLEVPQQVVDLVALYLGNLAVPARRDSDKPEVLAGERLFNSLGCDNCHRATLQVGEQRHTIHPYTDLLLHDMGEALADHRPEALANGREWRTAPLWGIGLTRAVSGEERYLHDGRARSLLEAVLWHGGEAQAQRDAVIALSREQREQLLAFIESL